MAWAWRWRGRSANPRRHAVQFLIEIPDEVIRAAYDHDHAEQARVEIEEALCVTYFDAISVKVLLGGVSWP
jgi:hypothetical protein